MLRQSLPYTKNDSDIMFCKWNPRVMRYSTIAITMSFTHTAEYEKWKQREDRLIYMQ